MDIFIIRSRKMVKCCGPKLLSGAAVSGNVLHPFMEQRAEVQRLFDNAVQNPKK